MLTILLFLPLLMIFMFMRLSVRAIIMSAFILLPVSAIWMGYNILTQHESSCLDNTDCVISPFAQFSPFWGWAFIASAILIICIGVFIIENIEDWSDFVLQFIIYVIILVGGFAPIFPDTCYHLTHHWPTAADIPVASDNPAHYADAIRYNARTPLQGSLLPLTRLVWA